jgi:hypothetical protein
MPASPSVPLPVPARRPRSSTAATVAHRPALGTQAFLGPAGDRPSAPWARRRAAPCRTTPPLSCDRAESGPLAAFSSLRSVGMAGRPIPPSLQSEKRTQRPNLGAIAESPLRSDSAGHGSFLDPPRSARRLRRPRRCRCGPLLRPAICRNLERASAHHLTTFRGPRDEALSDSATPTEASRRWVQAWGRQIRNPKSEIRNPSVPESNPSTGCCIS